MSNSKKGQLSPLQPTPERRAHRYLAKVEAELFALYRHGKTMSHPGANPTPTDMLQVMRTAERALTLLGWVPDEHATTTTP